MAHIMPAHDGHAWHKLLLIVALTPFSYGQPEAGRMHSLLKSSIPSDLHTQHIMACPRSVQGLQQQGTRNAHA